MPSSSSGPSSLPNPEPVERRRHAPPSPPWQSPHRQVLNQILAGSLAGMATSLATCPLDVVKVRLQSQLPDLSTVNNIPTTTTTTPSTIPNVNDNCGAIRYRGTIPSLRRIWRDEGVRGLYRGLGPSVIGYIPTFGIYFPIYTLSKTHLFPWLVPGWGGPTDTAVHVGSAVVAGASGTVLTNPLWVIRTRMITQSHHHNHHHHPRQPQLYRSSWHAARVILAQEGWRGFYKGLGPSLLGVLHVVVQFPTYERLKLILQQQSHHEGGGGGGSDQGPSSLLPPLLLPWQIFLASTLAKMTASTVTYPHEVLRTRLQNQRGGPGPPKYTSILQALRMIWLEEGVGGFYRGLPTNLLRVIPASAVTFLTYELILQRLEDLP